MRVDSRKEEDALRATLTFQQVAALGYAHLIPVIPPYAELSPHSKIDPSSRGKAPGVKAADGGWIGLGGWQSLDATPAELRTWEAQGASIGLRCDVITGIDVDITDKRLAGLTYKAISGQFGLPVNPWIRLGNPPKYLLPVIVTDGPVPSRVVKLLHGTSEYGIDLLSKGRQFVLHGIHPKTKGLYRWVRPDSTERGPPPAVDIPRITLAQLTGILEAIVGAVVADGGKLASIATVGGTRTVVNQDELKGPQDLVTKALRATPNGFSYDEWIRVGHALKAAAQDWDDAGLALWVEWSLTCSREPADEAYAEVKWGTFKGPFTLGADFLYDLAAKAGWDRAAAAAAEFEPLQIEPPPPSPAAPGAPLPPAPAQEPPPNVLALSELAQWSDAAVAARFAAEVRQGLIFVPERGIWYRFNGTCWAPDPSRLAAEHQAHVFLEREARRVQGLDPDVARKLAAKLLSADTLLKTERLARKFLLVPQERLDSDLWALNTPGGIYDLRTGELAPRGAALFTRATAVAPAARGAAVARFMRFMLEITNGDEELVQYLLRALGLTLWGSPIEPALFFLYGPGGNGKSVLTGILSDILGDLATVAAETVFLKQRSDQHPTATASLAGARMVLVPELPEGAKWNEAMLKRFSAGEPIKARFMGKDEFTYVPQGTLWFTANSKPTLHHVDPAIVRRLRLITFDFTPVKPDPWLREKIVKEEGPAILRLLIDAAAEVYRQGLGTAKAVELSTGEYFADSDPIVAYVRECCIVGPGEREAIGELHARYVVWQRDKVMDYPNSDMTIKLFSQRLAQTVAVQRTRSGDERYFKGIRLKVRGVPTTTAGAAAAGPLD